MGSAEKPERKYLHTTSPAIYMEKLLYSITFLVLNIT
jgi:hypothetical protein